MKTGIILEISNKKAAVLKTDGSFVTLPLKKDWKKGEIITFPDRTLHPASLYTIAACFVLLLISSLFIRDLYFKQTVLLSLDINPSIEIGLNRSLRVISMTALNKEGEDILSALPLKNKKYQDAIDLLLSDNSLKPYLDKTKGITFSLQTQNKKIETDLAASLQEYTENSIHHHHPATKVDVFTVTVQTVMDAHSYGVTAGKYLALLDLQSVDPQIDLNVYSHHSIDSIRQQARACEEEHGGVSGSHGSHCKHRGSGHE